MKLFKSETQKTVTFIIISSICLFMSLIQSVDELLHFNLSWVAIILCGLPIIKEADSKKAPIVSLTDRWATWIVVIALVSSIGTYLVTHQILRSVTILVVFCPCALVLATPTAIMAGIGNASKYGMLIKGGDVVERLSKIKNIAFDKTGTLTYGKLSVVEYKSFCPEYDDETFLKILASVEAYSEHPLGKAIISYYKENNEELLDIQNFTVNPGKGITANLGEKSILVGNLKLIKDVDINLNKDIINISEEFTKKGCTVIYLSIDNKLIGYVALSDILREEAKEVISYIKSQKINPIMLTGDNKNSAQNIASIVGIDDIHPSLLPEDKMNIIKNLEDSKSPTCMIGDGVNDALALKYSSAGISMGAIGSDIAIEASDIALASDDIKNIPYLLYLSKKTMKTIKLNVTFSLALNFLAIILAMTGILNPVVGALVHNLGSVFVILNSAKLLKTRNNLALNCKTESLFTNESKVALIV